MCFSLSLNPMPQHFPEISPQRVTGKTWLVTVKGTTNICFSPSNIPRLSHQGMSPEKASVYSEWCAFVDLYFELLVCLIVAQSQ